jgi:hypothetical protein
MTAWPLASVLTEEALMAPPVALKATSIPSMTALLASRVVAVMLASLELSDFTVASSVPRLIVAATAGTVAPPVPPSEGPAGASVRPPVPHPASKPRNAMISTGIISPGKRVAF